MTSEKVLRVFPRAEQGLKESKPESSTRELGGAPDPYLALEARDGRVPGRLQLDAPSLVPGANPSEFFPSDGVGVEFAQRICTHCPVRTECLEYALKFRIEHGVWAARPNSERRRILRRRRQLNPT